MSSLSGLWRVDRVGLLHVNSRASATSWQWLSGSERETLLGEDGTARFEPISGRPMREYVTIPDEWSDDLPRMEEWIHRSLTWAATMPEKKPKPRKRAKKG